MRNQQFELFIEKLKSVLVTGGTQQFQEGYERYRDQYQPLLGYEHWDRLMLIMDLEKVCGVHVDLSVFDKDECVELTLGELYYLFYPIETRAA